MSDAFAARDGEAEAPVLIIALMHDSSKPGPVRRVVTGHDPDGAAIVASDGELPTAIELPLIPGTVFHEVWSTQGMPAGIGNGADPTTGAPVLPPPGHGTRIRFVDIPPETPEMRAVDLRAVEAAFVQIGAAGASTAGEGAPHPLMHRTESIDYAIVMDGEITLVLDEAEVELEAGSVVIQRGTNHAWANRGDRPCRMLFVLIDGRYEEEIASALRSG